MASVVTGKDYSFRIRRGYERAVDQAVRKVALDTEADAKTRITVHDAIDTGAARASIYLSAGGSSGYAKATAEATALAARPGKHSGRPHDVRFFPERMAGHLEACISVAVEYGANIEYGTAHVPARPYFVPAVEGGMGVLMKAIADKINKEVK